MFNTINLRNFKSFKDKQNVPLKPITLLYGPNSSGKSSLINSLLLLKQSVNEIYNYDTVLIPKGNIVNLGSYRDMIYGRQISYGIKDGTGKRKSIILGNSFTINIKKGDCSNTNEEIKYEMHFICDELQQIHIEKIHIYYSDLEIPLLRLQEDNEEIIEEEYYAKGYNGPGSFGNNQSRYCIKEIDKENPFIEKLFDKYSEVNESAVKIDLLKNLSQRLEKETKFNLHSFLIIGAIVKKSKDEGNPILKIRDEVLHLIMKGAYEYKKLLDSILYIGPSREYPERYSIFSGRSHKDVGRTGKYTAELLASDEILRKKVNEWFGRFELDYEIQILTVNGHIEKTKDEDDNNKIVETDLYLMRLRDKKNNVMVGLSDVGFGVSQLLPIIVQCLCSKDSTIIIEQPEIHIHPRLQTTFASLIKDCISNNNQFIIETHSEHIALRIKKLIRENENLKNSDVSIIYVLNGEGNGTGSYTVRIRLDEKGEFLDVWPDGFFDDRYKELIF